MNRLSKVPFRDYLNTDGSGFWSREVATVPVTHLQVPYIDEEEEFGELCVYFNTNEWRVDRQGMIYGDQLWLNELCYALSRRGYDTSDVGYSEYGMQGDDYVSLDVGEKFIASWLAKHAKVAA